jgi:MipA family protein
MTFDWQLPYQINRIMKKTLSSLCLTTLISAIALSMTPSCHAEGDTLNNKLTGDIGVGIYHTPTITSTNDKSNALLPYIYADWGSAFARVDTFGVKVVPMGQGHLELVTRVSFENYRSNTQGIQDRARPTPIGIGTFQQGDWGGLFLYAFHDTHSEGSLLEGTYAAMFTVKSVNFYPQIGIERRSSAYVQSLYGVSVNEATANGKINAYQAGNAISPNIAFAVEYPLNEDYKLNLYAKKKWLGNSISDSPLVNTSTQTSGFISLSRTFN